MKTLIKLSPLALLTLFGLSEFTYAATVNVGFGYENRTYASAPQSNYKGWRGEVIIQPNNSNWFFNVLLNQYRRQGVYNPATHTQEKRSDYIRMDFKTSYRFKLKNGWVKPEIGYRQDTTSYGNNRSIYNYYSFASPYLVQLNDRWQYIAQYFSITFLNMEKGRTDKSGVRSSQIGYEIEQGLNYSITPRWWVRLSFNDNANQINTDDLVNSQLIRHSQQIRFYTSYSFPFGLSISPYFRKSIFAKNKVINNDGSITRQDYVKYAIAARQTISNNIYLSGEFSQERFKNLTGSKQGTTDKNNYLRLGLNFTF